MSDSFLSLTFLRILVCYQSDDDDAYIIVTFTMQNTPREREKVS